MTSPRRRVEALLALARILDGGTTVAVPSGEVVAIAEELVIMPALRCRPGVLEALTAEDAGRVRQFHMWNAARNIAFRHRLVEAITALNARGIVPLLFKGGLSLVDGSVTDVGARWMADLDVVVPVGTLATAVEALNSAGYRAAPGKPFLHPHELPLVRERSPGPLELHEQLGSPPIPSVLPATEAWANSSELSFGGADARALSPTHQVLHSVLHAAVQDLNHAVAGLPLRQLLTLAHLARAHGGAVDWEAVASRMEAHGLHDVLVAHVWLAHRLAGLELPPIGAATAKARLHEARVLANFALGWPADLQRNLRHAFGAAYLDSVYGHGGHPLKLAAARARHAVELVRRDGRGVVTQALERRI